MNRKFIFDSNCVLKSIFSNEENIDILQDFIETVLKIKITKIQLRDDLEDEYIFGKYLGFANVKIITDTNLELNIGMQIVDGYYIQNKILLHYAQLYSNTIKTITINILSGVYFNTANYHKIMKIKDLSYKGECHGSEQLGELHVLELPKFIDTQLDTKEKAWISYFKHGDFDMEVLNNYEKIERLDNILNQYWIKERL